MARLAVPSPYPQGDAEGYTVFAILKEVQLFFQGILLLILTKCNVQIITHFMETFLLP